MNFIIETITPDFFYYNLLLGLPKILDNRKQRGIKKKHLVRFEPATEDEITTWEETHQVKLPTDLKTFYQSTNGFLYQWICSYGHQKLLVMGKISIYPLHKLVEITNFPLWTSPEMDVTDGIHTIKLSTCSKVFELCSVEDDYKICLIYLSPEVSPSIWLHSRTKDFFYLAKTFTEYFRMCIAHLGLPHWQLAYTSSGLPEWVKILARILCPALLQAVKQKRNIELISTDRVTRSANKYVNTSANILDHSVFTESYHSKRRGRFNNNKSSENVDIFVLKSPPKKKPKIKSGKPSKHSHHTRSKLKSKKGYHS